MSDAWETANCRISPKKIVKIQAYSEPLREITEKQIRWVIDNSSIFLKTIYTVGIYLNGRGQMILMNMCKICFYRAFKKIIL